MATSCCDQSEAPSASRRSHRIPLWLSKGAPLFGRLVRECNASDRCQVTGSPLPPILSVLLKGFVYENKPCPAIRDLETPRGQFVSPELILESRPQDDFRPTAGCLEQGRLRHLWCLNWTASRLPFGTL